jgi:hypothetical protein
MISRFTLATTRSITLFTILYAVAIAEFTHSIISKVITYCG